jgi:hypothetical protein
MAIQASGVLVEKGVSVVFKKGTDEMKWMTNVFQVVLQLMHRVGAALSRLWRDCHIIKRHQSAIASLHPHPPSTAWLVQMTGGADMISFGPCREGSLLPDLDWCAHLSS